MPVAGKSIVSREECRRAQPMSKAAAAVALISTPNLLFSRPRGAIAPLSPWI
jgi:hypothetical protein